MKVFELMEKLAKHPAGAEVEFSFCMTEKEFLEQGEIVDEEEGEGVYTLNLGTREVSGAGEAKVFIY